jgi:hypothetical protein
MYKNNVGVPYVLRNYVAGHEPPADITIAEAMLATCATPPMFTPTSVYKDFSNFEYIGGDLGLSNPTGEIIAEAHRAFGDEATVACLLSVGCGHSGIKSSPSDSGAATWIDFLNRVSIDSEKTAREMARRMKYLTLYHRLSVDYGLATDQLNAWRDPVVIAAHTATYLGNLEVAERVNCCVGSVIHGDGFSTLEQLSELVINTDWLLANCGQAIRVVPRFPHQLCHHSHLITWNERKQPASWRMQCSINTVLSNQGPRLLW